MGTTQNRNIGGVIDQLIAASDSEQFTKELQHLGNKIRYTAPELFGSLWNELNMIFNMHVNKPVHELNEQELKLLEIYLDEDTFKSVMANKALFMPPKNPNPITAVMLKRLRERGLDIGEPGDLGRAYASPELAQLAGRYHKAKRAIESVDIRINELALLEGESDVAANDRRDA